MTSVVFVAGPAGVGKTTLANALARRLRCTHLDFDVVSAPVVEQALAQHPDMGEAEVLLLVKDARYEALRTALTEHIATHTGVPVVVSAPFTRQVASPAAWEPWSAAAPTSLLVWLHLDEAERTRRVRKRGSTRDVGAPVSVAVPPAVPHLDLDARLPIRELCTQFLRAWNSPET